MEVSEIDGIRVRVVASLDGYPALLVDGVLLVEDTGDERLNILVARAAMSGKSTSRSPMHN
jgi:hypothetical protein